MTTTIHTIHMGLDNIYVLKENGTVIIDGGDPKKEKTFLKGLEDASVKPEDVQLIILTHGHWDHIGSAAGIKEITGARILMHERERKWIEIPIKKMPPGVTTRGKFIEKLTTWVMLPFIHLKPTAVDIAVGDEDVSLEEYGISGKVVFTPGHTAGSISVLLDSGEAFIGDLAMNGFPLSSSPGLPIFAEDMSTVLASWRKLLALNIKTIYPAHGASFPADIMKKVIENAALN